MAVHRRDVPFELELGNAICRCLRELDYPTTLVHDGEIKGLQADILLLLVNLANFPEYSHQLKRAALRRPLVVLWQMDPLPPPGIPRQAEKIGLRAALWRERFHLHRSAASMSRWQKLRTLIRLREWACKQCSTPGFRTAWQLTQACDSMDDGADWRQLRGVLQNWWSILDAQRHGWVDHFMSSTQQRQRFLESRGIESSFIPVGAYPELGRDLHLVRDIPVTFLGRARFGRRKAHLDQLTRGLAKKGVRLNRIEGDCYGERRCEMLNRTRILINLHNYAWSPAWIRFVMAALCGALIVSEPADDDQPFSTGAHYVGATPDEMPDMILRLLDDPATCDRITCAAAGLCANELTLQRAVQVLSEKVSSRDLISCQN